MTTATLKRAKELESLIAAEQNTLDKLSVMQKADVAAELSAAGSTIALDKSETQAFVRNRIEASYIKLKALNDEFSAL